MQEKSATIGLLCILGWCFFSALSRVITSNATQHIEPAVICFYTFLISSIVFLLLNIRNTKHTLSKLKERENLRYVIWLNISTFGGWFFLIYPLKYIEPAMVSTMTLGLSPMATLIMGFFIYNTNQMDPFDILISSLSFIVILYIVVLCFLGITTLEPLTTKQLIYAIGSCFVVGFATAVSNLYAKKLSNNQFSSTEISALRFLLTVILSYVISVILRNKLSISDVHWNHIFLVAGCLVIIPLYLVQVGIKRLEPITVAVIAPFMPVLVFVFEYVNGQRPSHEAILATAMTLLLVLFSVYVHYQKIKKRRHGFSDLG